MILNQTIKLKLLFTAVFLFINCLHEANAASTVLNQPGVFYYGGNVEADPIISNDAIIQISANDVVVDLGEHSLLQNSDNTQTGLCGIIVAPNVQNVVIKNGIIENLSGVGIIIGEGAQVTIEDLVINNCALGGIQFNGSASNPIDQSFIRNCRISNCCQLPASQSALSLAYCTNIHIDNCYFNNNGQTTNNLDVINLTSCSQCELNTCLINGNAGSLLNGIHLINSSLNLFDNCQITNNYAQSNAFIGFASDASNYGHIFKNCLVQGNGSDGGEVSGFSAHSNSACTFENCRVSTNQATAVSSIIYGFKIYNSQSIHLNKCFALNNSNTGPNGNSYGILWHNNSQSYLTDSVAENNSAVNQGYGMLINLCHNYGVQNSQFNSNKGGVQTRGLKISGSSQRFVTNNTAFNNGTTPLEQIDGLSAKELVDIESSSPNLTKVKYPLMNVRVYA